MALVFVPSPLRERAARKLRRFCWVRGSLRKTLLTKRPPHPLALVASFLRPLPPGERAQQQPPRFSDAVGLKAVAEDDGGLDAPRHSLLAGYGVWAAQL